MSNQVHLQVDPRSSTLRAAGAWAALVSLIGIVILLLAGGAWAMNAVTAGRIDRSAAPAAATSRSTGPAAGAMSRTGAASVASISASASQIPPPITRTVPATVTFELTTSMVTAHLDGQTTYTYWTFNSQVPGPMLRVMQGDTVVIHLKNSDPDMFHSIDLHAVSGPGGGSSLTQTAPGKESTFTFKALQPGLFIYHCATQPVSMHVANGMYGMILVEPPGGLPHVDREYYLVQSEFYTAPPGADGLAAFSDAEMMQEHPGYVVFNGAKGAFMGANALHAKVGERIRLFVGVGTWLPSNFHVIGAIFDNVYPDGGIGGPPEHNVQTVVVPAGGATIVEFTPKEPGTYTFVDHSMPHMDLGAMGQIVVEGRADPTIYRAGT